MLGAELVCVTHAQQETGLCGVTLRLYSVSKQVWPAAQFASPLASSSSFSLAVLGTSLAAARQATVQRRGANRYLQ